MGRPIKKRFFNGAGNSGSSGGEGVASLRVHGGNSYSAGTTISFATPPTGGSAATASITFVTPTGGNPGNGNVASVTLTSAGSGYLVRNLPATFTKPANVVVTAYVGGSSGYAGGPSSLLNVSTTTGLYVGMVANVAFATLTSGNPTRITAIFTGNSNILLSTANSAAITSPISFGDVGSLGNVVATMDAVITTANTIQGNAYLSAGAGGRICDIVSQRSSRRYRVTNDEGTGVVRLIKSTEVGAANTAGGPPSAGLMTILASDSDGGTYWVTKVDGRTATITAGSTTPGAQFPTANTQVAWTLNAAVASTSVKLATND